MTLNDLKNEVLALTFETELESYSAFIFAVNRALVEIYSERDVTKTVEIYKKKLVPRELFERINHTAGVDCEIELSGKSFSFTVSGNGKLLFTDGGTTEEISFSGASTKIRKIARTGKAFLNFTGDFDYDVYNLASFDFIKSQNENDVPIYSEFEVIDMRVRDPLFLAFTSEIKRADGSYEPVAKIVGSSILLPKDYEGKIVISYKRLPRKITDGEIDTVLDIPDELSHLLALRCAAYLLFDENEGLAQYYLSLYKSGLSAIKLYCGKGASAEYRDVLGWV